MADDDHRDAETPLLLKAYATEYAKGAAAMRFVPASGKRDWMDTSDNRFAYRCLPMTIANQCGWVVLNPHKVAITWDGGKALGSIKIAYLEGDGRPRMASSMFGMGIVTWLLPYLIRTPPGYNLLVRGPANSPKDGISPLEGVVETDWVDSTFTMNWKMTRPNHPVIFDVGEPIAMLVPQARGELEAFRPEIHDLQADAQTHEAYLAWNKSRAQFSFDLIRPDVENAGWQKHYMRGVSLDGKRAGEHQSKLALRDFADRRDGRD